MQKRQRNIEKHSMFGHLLLKLEGGGYTYMQYVEGVNGQARVHGGGGGGGCRGGLAPLVMRKKAVRGNFNLFHLCFTNEIRGGSIHYTCKMEGGGRTGAKLSMVGGVGGEGALPPPP